MHGTMEGPCRTAPKKTARCGAIHRVLRVSCVFRCHVGRGVTWARGLRCTSAEGASRGEGGMPGGALGAARGGAPARTEKKNVAWV